MQLVRQAAAGDGSMSLFTTNTVPHYRFSYLLDRAKDMANTVSQLGSALLDALEKKMRKNWRCCKGPKNLSCCN